MNIRTRFAIVTLWLAAPALSLADIVQATYHITASDFLNAGPPPPPTSNFVEGSYTFTFDTSQVTQNELVPDAVIGLDIVDNDGATFDYDETNSGVNTEVMMTPGFVHITIGGTQGSVAFVFGRTPAPEERFSYRTPALAYVLNKLRSVSGTIVYAL